MDNKFDEEKAGYSTAYAVQAGVDGIPVKRNRWEVATHPSSFAPNAKHSNVDLDPTGPEERTWATWNFSVYWLCDAIAPSIWEVGSSMVAVGLNWKLSIVANAIGMLIISAIITINGNIGVKIHIPFAVMIRASFGPYFAYFAIISRAITAMFWLGIGSVTGGQCIDVFFGALWPSWKTLPNHLPESAGITSTGMAAYFIYFCIQIIFFIIPFHKLRWFFAFKSVVAGAAFLAIMGSTVHSAHGLSGSTLFVSTNPLSGSALVWSWFSNMNSVIGGWATLGVNIMDLSRYSKTRNTQNTQFLLIPVFFTAVSTMGIVTAAAAQKVYGEAIWYPTSIISNWTSHGGRAGAAFCALGLLTSQIGINVAANSISAANDIMSMFPRYVNLRRGQLIAAIIGCWILVPWYILAAAIKFLLFMSGYTIFLGPITGIMTFDYYILRKGHLSVPELYDMQGIYRYNKIGTNYRALVAFICGMVPGLPGMINYINSSISVPVGLQNLFAIGYIYSFTTAGVVYVGLSWAFPHKESEIDSLITGEEVVEQFKAVH